MNTHGHIHSFNWFRAGYYCSELRPREVANDTTSSFMRCSLTLCMAGLSSGCNAVLKKLGSKALCGAELRPTAACLPCSSSTPCMLHGRSSRSARIEVLVHRGEEANVGHAHHKRCGAPKKQQGAADIHHTSLSTIHQTGFDQCLRPTSTHAPISAECGIDLDNNSCPCPSYSFSNKHSYLLWGRMN